MSDLRESVLMHREQVRGGLSAAGLDWLEAIRDEGAARFAELGLPDARDENWRYTNLRRFARDFPLPSVAAPGPAPEYDAITGFDEACRLVFVDGTFDAANSSIDNLPAGVTVASLRTLLEQQPARLKGLIGARINAETIGSEDGLRALNTAYLNDGAVVLVDDGVQFEQPVEMIFASSAGRAETTLLRTLIVVGKGARASVVERYVGAGGNKPLTHTVSEVALGANAWPHLAVCCCVTIFTCGWMTMVHIASYRDWCSVPTDATLTITPLLNT